MKKQYIQAKIQTVGKKIEFVASDETVDRYGEILMTTDWDLKNFKKNPVLLVNHDYRVENIVGKAKNIRRNIQEKKLIFEAVFHDITEKAQSVKKLVEEKFLNTVSVGFIPHTSEKEKSVTLELLEISFVPIPANPSAEQLMVKGFEKIKDIIKDEDKKQIEKFIEEEKDSCPLCKVSKETIKILEKKIEKQALSKEASPQVNRPKENSRAVTRVEKKLQRLDLRMLQKVAKYVNNLLYEARRK